MGSLLGCLQSNAWQRVLFSAVGARLTAGFHVSRWAHESWACCQLPGWDWCAWCTIATCCCVLCFGWAFPKVGSIAWSKKSKPGWPTWAGKRYWCWFMATTHGTKTTKKPLIQVKLGYRLRQALGQGEGWRHSLKWEFGRDMRNHAWVHHMCRPLFNTHLRFTQPISHSPCLTSPKRGWQMWIPPCDFWGMSLKCQNSKDTWTYFLSRKMCPFLNNDLYSWMVKSLQALAGVLLSEEGFRAV